ncbi:MAG TPA: SDR family oxidoreductase [Longimicrobiales bacterium]|nr:SDR family oxidoreductase [Longimicrobiales bacterium]
MEIRGTTALVTGAGRRVGRTLALALAEAGADVIVNYHQSAAAAAETVAAIEQLGRRARAVRADIAQPEQARALVAAALDAFGRLDILVNSASRFERAPLAEITPEDWDRVLGVNLKAPFLLAQAAADALRAAHGTIINIVDLSAFQPWPSFIPHAVSKAGLLHLTRGLARALAPHVRVNAIAPGTVLPPEDYDGTDYAGGADRRVLERAGTPEDVARALLYLAGSDFVTGEVLVVDGGRLLL